MPELPSPRLPWDVLLLVFKEADPSTLAVLGRVSLDFLASTAPMLYRDVEVSSVEKLKMLFCRREKQIGRKTKNSSAISLINSHLNLDQIRNLSINFHRFPINSQVEISASRIHQASLLLDSLKISYDYQVYQKAYGPSQIFFDSLLPHLNPLQCTYHLIERPPAETPWVRIGSSSASVTWTRTQELELSGGITYSFDGEAYHLGGLPDPSLLQRRTVRLHVASLLLSKADPSLEAVLELFSQHSRNFNLRSMQERSMKLVVQTGEEAKEAREAVRTNEKIARWRSLFDVEVET